MLPFIIDKWKGGKLTSSQEPILLNWKIVKKDFDKPDCKK